MAWWSAPSSGGRPLAVKPVIDEAIELEERLAAEGDRDDQGQGQGR